MPALNFKKEFTAHIYSGKKHQTIRATRKRPIKVGDKLYLYTGMRTKKCKKIGDVVCTKAESIVIDRRTGIIIDQKFYSLLSAKVERLAKADGFKNKYDFLNFFISDKNPHFEGQIIYW